MEDMTLAFNDLCSAKCDRFDQFVSTNNLGVVFPDFLTTNVTSSHLHLLAN